MLAPLGLVGGAGRPSRGAASADTSFAAGLGGGGGPAARRPPDGGDRHRDVSRRRPRADLRPPVLPGGRGAHAARDRRDHHHLRQRRPRRSSSACAAARSAWRCRTAAPRSPAGWAAAPRMLPMTVERAHGRSARPEIPLRGIEDRAHGSDAGRRSRRSTACWSRAARGRARRCAGRRGWCAPARRRWCLHDVAAGEAAFGGLLGALAGPLRFLLNNPFERADPGQRGGVASKFGRRASSGRSAQRPARQPSVRPGARAVRSVRSRALARGARDAPARTRRARGGARRTLHAVGGRRRGADALRIASHCRRRSGPRRSTTPGAGSRARTPLTACTPHCSRARPQVTSDGRDYPELPGSAALLLGGVSTPDRRRSDTATAGSHPRAVRRLGGRQPDAGPDGGQSRPVSERDPESAMMGFREDSRRPGVGRAIAALMTLWLAGAPIPARASRHRVVDHQSRRGRRAGRVARRGGGRRRRDRLGPRTESWAAESTSVIWAIAALPDGAVAIAGEGGRIERWTAAGGLRPWLKLPVGQVLSLASDGDGLLAGTGPDGVIYRVGAKGDTSVMARTGERYVWGLAPGARGVWYAATGTRGRLLSHRGRQGAPRARHRREQPGLDGCRTATAACTWAATPRAA